MKKKFKKKNRRWSIGKKYKTINHMYKQEYMSLDCIDVINFMDKTVYVLVYDDDKIINGTLSKGKSINKNIHIKGEFILIHRKLYETTENYVKYIIGHELGHIYFRKKFIEDCVFHMVLFRRRIGVEILCDLFSFNYYNLDIDTIKNEIQTVVKKVYEEINEKAIKETNSRLRMCKKISHADLDIVYNDYKRFLISCSKREDLLESIEDNNKKYLDEFNKIYKKDIRSVYQRRRLMEEKLELLNKNIGGK